MTDTGVVVDLTLEDRVLDAVKACCERWGMAKVTIDDIANQAGCSRATVYRLFPGGKDFIYEALRQRENREFFAKLATWRANGYEDLMGVSSRPGARADEHPS